MGGREVNEEPEIPEYVDLEKMEYAQKIRRAGIMFCRKCGATRPKHGFYPLISGVAYEGEHDLATTSPLICNCCHTSAQSPCFYCEEEKRTGREIDVGKEREKT